MLNSEIKIEKKFPNMLCRFSNGLFALKKCHIDLTNNKNQSTVSTAKR